MLVLPLLLATAAWAGVEFENCQPSGDGGITCDTRPTGNTRMDEQDARYGLLDQATPGWREFDPAGGEGEFSIEAPF